MRTTDRTHHSSEAACPWRERDRQRAVDRMGADEAVDVVHAGDRIRREHLARRPRGDDATCIQNDDVVADQRREVDVVQARGRDESRSVR
jgi:hypothetical protein